MKMGHDLNLLLRIFHVYTTMNSVLHYLFLYRIISDSSGLFIFPSMKKKMVFCILYGLSWKFNHKCGSVNVVLGGGPVFF